MDSSTLPAVVGGVVVAGVVLKSFCTPRPVKVASHAPTLALPKEHYSEYPPLSRGQSHATTDKNVVAKINYSEEGLASEKSNPAVTLPALLAKAAELKGHQPALRVERDATSTAPVEAGQTPPASRPREQWMTITYAEYHEMTRMVARGFLHLGLEKMDSVNIFGFNSPEWIIAELGAITAGGMAAGIYPTDTPEQVCFKALHSHCSIAVVDNDKKMEIFLDLKKKNKLPHLKAIVNWGSDIQTKTTAGVTICSWASLLGMGKNVSERILDKIVGQLNPGAPCALIYTSGTTGHPKAVMISHDNIIFTTAGVLSALETMEVGRKDEQERVISYLPLSHVAGMAVDVVVPIWMTANLPAHLTVHFARPYDLKRGSLADRLRAVQPTIFLGVPRVWEKISEAMKAAVAKAPMTGLKLKLVRWAKSVGIAHQRNCQMGGSGAKPFGYGFAERKVLSAVKLKLGLDQMKLGFTGAAPITKETLEFFGAVGININEAYGMSECSGATTWSTDQAHVWGCCGWAMSGMEVKIFQCKDNDINKKVEAPHAEDIFNAKEEEQGEICYRGRHIMLGYMANPTLGKDHVQEIEGKNNAAIDFDGWLHSGDKGCKDALGNVKITGRYKELIIGAGGENIAPVPVEDCIKRLCPAVSNVMMVGDKKKFCVALLTLKAKGATGEFPGGDELAGEALELHQDVTTVSGAIGSKQIVDQLTAILKQVNADGKACPSNASRIQKFTILPRDFSVETGEFTATLKLRRGEVMKKQAALIERLYASKETYVSSE